MHAETINKKQHVMRKLALILVLVACTAAAAQNGGTVTGTVKDKATGAAVEFAAAAIYDAATGKMAGGGTTGGDGRFTISGVAEGTYYVECSFVGYKAVRSAAFAIGKKGTADIGTVYISSDDKTLDEVVVETRRPTFTASLDCKVYNVGEDLTATTGSAGDLMQNIPSVEVDMDGNISLRGSSDVTVLVNGKPSAMMGARTRGDALNYMPASQIERIEVITNPSAEYKPDGAGGIINIVMKQDSKPGVKATLTAGAGSAGRHNAGIDASYGIGRLNLHGGYTYRRDRYDRSTVDLRTSPTAVTDQRTYGRGLPTSHTARIGGTLDITPRDVLESSFSYNNRRFRRDERITSATDSTDGTPLSQYRRVRDALAKEHMYGADVQFTHTYGKEREFGAGYQYSSETEDENNDYATSQTSGDTRDRQHVWDANYIHTATLHATHRINGNLKLQAGYEFEHLRAEQGFHVYNLNGTDYVKDDAASSDFVHLRLVNSLYATAEVTRGAWTALAGLRGEYVKQENRLLSEGSSSSRHYANLYPTLHISRKIGQRNEVSLGYSLRVNRPEGEDMNPFAERINPLSLQAGNPDLRPEKIHSAEAGWQWRGDALSVMATLYYRYLTNEITAVSRYIDNGVLLTTKENLNSSQNAGLELIANGQAARWLAFNCNLNGYYNEIDATALGYGRRKGTFSWSVMANADVTPFKHCMVQVNARFRSSTLVPQGRRDADSRINLGVKYDIPRWNLAFTASVTDLLDTYRRSYTLDTPDLKQKVEQRRNPRIFALGAVWRFGADTKKKHPADMQYDDTF